MNSTPTEFVADTKFRVEFNSNLVYRYTFQSTNAQGRQLRRRERRDVWEQKESVGSGSYGNVLLYKCLTSEDQAELQAVKMVSKKSLFSGGIDLFKELEAIAKFSRQKYRGLFVEYHGWYENDDSIFIAMEYMKHGDLGSYLTKPLFDNEALEITFQVAEGLEHMHKDGFVHRDLKPENIFVVTKGPQWWVKIGDFGFSKRIKDDSSLRSMVGTRLYAAPEVQMIYPSGSNGACSMQYNYSEKVDIWSLGVMLFYMIFHEYPFSLESNPQGLQKYVDGAPLEYPGGFTVGTARLISDMMARHPAARPAAQDLVQDDWLKPRPPPNPEDLQRSVEMSTPASHSSSLGETRPLPSDAELSWEEVAKAREKSKLDSDEMLNTLRKLGMTMYEQNYFQDAALAFHKESEGRLNSLGPGNPSTLTALQWLGQSFYYGENYPQAIDKFCQVVVGRTKYLSPSHVDTLTSLEWLGRALYWNEQYAEAEKELRRAFEGRQMILGMQNEHTLKSLEWLGQSIYWQGDYVKAETCFQQVVEGRLKILGPTSEETHRSLEWLGRALYWGEKYGEASAVLVTASEGRKKFLGNTHLHTLTSLEWLGRAQYYNETYGEAEAAFRQCVEGFQSTLGNTDSRTLTSLEWLGRSLYYSEEYVKAEEAFREVFKGRKETLGIDDSHTIGSLQWLGRSIR
ncbi:hypothetical protein N7450_000380 [Penicillium hetheringtonii]|uniref:Serine/threonine-protein kinase ATG1 n=1 Tax=Penicillium hetheringtonii TaxID=911720 RepID=A0AAD6H191_9EURO|nr:hypothetical protein N7450_000380 [Penicillium hetheringtonii]